MPVQIKQIITGILFSIITSVGNNIGIAATNSPNQVIVRPGEVFPTNYNAPIIQPKQPFIPMIENKTDTPQTGIKFKKDKNKVK